MRTFSFWCSNMYFLIREQRHTSIKLIPEALYEEVETHRASPGLYPGCCRGPRCWGPSRRDRGPVWRGRDGTGPEAADPETNTSTSVLSNIKRQTKRRYLRCSAPLQPSDSHHGDEGSEGQSADGAHDAAESDQTERTEAPPADGTVCTIKTRRRRNMPTDELLLSLQNKFYKL